MPKKDDEYNSALLWESCSFENPRAIALYNSESTYSTYKNLYVCNYGGHFVSMLRSDSGQLVQKIDLYIRSPYGIVAISENEIVVSDFTDNFVRVWRYQSDNGRWQQVVTIGSVGEAHCQIRWPQGVAFDQASKNIIVCDSGNSRLQIFSKDGTFLKLFEFSSRNHCPDGLCVNNHTGELLVSDYNENLVHIFK